MIHSTYCKGNSCEGVVFDLAAILVGLCWNLYVWHTWRFWLKCLVSVLLVRKQLSGGSMMNRDLEITHSHRVTILICKVMPLQLPDYIFATLNFAYMLPNWKQSTPLVLMVEYYESAWSVPSSFLMFRALFQHPIKRLIARSRSLEICIWNCPIALIF